MAGENPTTKFKVDISDLKKNITEANRQVKLYRAELANASAGMKKGEETADSLTKKIEAQAKIVEAEKKKLQSLKDELDKYEKTIKDGEKVVSDLTKKHDEAAKAFGKDSDEAKALAKQLKEAQAAQERNTKAADDLRIKIINQDTAVKNAEGQAKRFADALDVLQKKEKETGDEAEKTTDGGLESFAVALGNLAANVITAAISKLGELGVAALDASKKFDEGRDNLIKATGAIGEQADELTAAYSQAAKSVVGDLGDIGSAVGEVNTRFGYTGDKLSEVSEDFLKFSNITGVDAVDAVRGVARALESSGEDLDSYGSLLDKIAAASQSSGISAGTLTEALTKNGAQMRSLGFDLDGTIALLAQFEKSGVNSETAITGLKKATGAWAKDGKDAQEELQKTITAIRNATDETKAAEIAVDAFGSKAGTELADAIRRGGFEFGSFAEIVSNASGTVSNTYEETQSGLDKISLAMQGLSVTAGEAAGALADEFGGGIVKIIDSLSGALSGDEGALTELTTAISDFIGQALNKAVDMLPGAVDFALSLVMSLADAIIDALPGAVEAIISAAETAIPKLAKFLTQLLEKLVGFVQNNLDPILSAVAGLVDIILDTLLDSEFLGKVVELAGDLVLALVDGLTGDGMEKLQAATVKLTEKLLDVLLDPAFMQKLFEAAAKIIAALVKAFVDLTPKMIGQTALFVDSIINSLLSADWAAIGEGIVNGIIGGADAVDLTAFWDDWFSGLEDIKQGLNKAKDFCLNVWQKVKDAFSTARQFFRDTFQQAWDAVKGVFSGVGSFFAGIWDTIKSQFTSIGTKIGQAVGGAFKGAINSVLATVERNLNFIPSAVNSLLDTLNALPGVSISRMNGVSLPRLAKGAIIDKATIAQVGEDGREAVIPLERNKQGLKEIAGLLAQEMGGGLPGIGGRMHGGTVVNLTQNNTSPKALSRYEIYRQTKNMLEAVKLQGAF